MFVQEYQAKNLLNRFSLPFPAGAVAMTAQQAVSAAEAIEADFWVVKAQVLAGDRGKFGGIKNARSLEEVGSVSKSLLGTTLVTTQTGESGLPVKSVYVEHGCAIECEMYLAVLLDRLAGELVLLATSSGGTDVESAVHQSPGGLHRIALSVSESPSEDELRSVAQVMELEGDCVEQYVEICQNMHRALVELDATLIELNPLIVTGDGHLVGLDVKMEIDDNALFRHAEYEEIRNVNFDPDRILRAHSGFNYVRLNGDIGLLVGGAGLALATMDLVKLHGGEPANFLDLPPIATRENVADACRTILDSSSLKALFVNVVGGGLTHCDTVAEGLITASKESAIRCPVVVRFAGTSKDHAVVLLKNARIPFTLAGDMSEAVEILMKLVKAK